MLEAFLQRFVCTREISTLCHSLPHCLLKSCHTNLTREFIKRGRRGSGLAFLPEEEVEAPLLILMLKFAHTLLDHMLLLLKVCLQTRAAIEEEDFINFGELKAHFVQVCHLNCQQVTVFINS